MNVSVIGAGHVGLVTAACFADLGHTVWVVNRNTEKAAAINAGKPPFHEQGLEELLIRHAGTNLFAGTGYDPIAQCDLIFICVGTPSAKDGNADLSLVKAASLSVGDALRETERDHVVVVKSTVPPGSTERLVRPAVLEQAGRNDIGFAANPEFLREGYGVEDFQYPDRIVIGSNDQQTLNQVTAAYDGINAPILKTGITAAEMIKYASNAFLATKISFANEMGNICKQLGVDVYEVMQGVGMDHRISPHFLNAGVGFGGPCLQKDTSALIRLAENLGEEPQLLPSVLEVNEGQPLRMVTLLEHRIGSLAGKRIAVLGLAFKAETDDVRDSRAISVIRSLLDKGAVVVAYDPIAIPAMRCIFPEITYCTDEREALKEADACLIMTEWPQFSMLDDAFEGMRAQVVIEGRRILTCGTREGLCW